MWVALPTVRAFGYALTRWNGFTPARFVGLQHFAGLLTEIEDRLHIIIEDEDVDAEMLETYGGLLAFAEMKVVAA